MFLLKREFRFFIPGLFLIYLLSVTNAQATFVSGYGDIEISDLRFSSPDPDAQLIWTDVWYGTVFSDAHDSDSGYIDDFDELFGDDGSINTQATTAHADSEADYEVTNGGLVAIDPSAGIGAAVQAAILLTDADKHAEAFSVTEFDNYFVIAGGVAGELVEITFELDYSGQLIAVADHEGFIEILLGAILQIEDDLGDTLLDDFFFDAQFFKDSSDQKNYSGTLAVTLDLVFEEEYLVFAGAGTEIYGETVVAPNVFLLMISGLGLLFWKHLNSKQTE